MEPGGTARGGEGVEQLLASRDRQGFDSSGNWCMTIFSFRGRATPVVPLLVYYLYCLVVVAVIMTRFQHIFVVCQQSYCYLDSLTTPVSIVGSALFFLLVFRTNSSYARWWEGRKVWGQIVTTARNMARHAAVFLNEKDVALDIIRWAGAYPIVLKSHLREEKDLSEVGQFLDGGQIEDVIEASSMPMHVMLRLSSAIRCIAVHKLLPEAQIYYLDQNLEEFMGQLAAAECIRKTPMPFAYVAHLRTFMVLWLMSLPFVLIHDLEWLILVVCVIIGYVIMGIEGIGVEIENPFGRDYNDLPLDTLVAKCSDNLLAMMAFVEQQKGPPMGQCRNGTSVGQCGNDASVGQCLNGTALGQSQWAGSPAYPWEYKRIVLFGSSTVGSGDWATIAQSSVSGDYGLALSRDCQRTVSKDCYETVLSGDCEPAVSKDCEPALSNDCQPAFSGENNAGLSRRGRTRSNAESMRGIPETIPEHHPEDARLGPSPEGESQEGLGKEKLPWGSPPVLSRDGELASPGDDELAISRDDGLAISKGDEPPDSKGDQSAISEGDKPETSGGDEPAISGGDEPAISGGDEPAIFGDDEPEFSRDGGPDWQGSDQGRDGSWGSELGNGEPDAMPNIGASGCRTGGSSTSDWVEGGGSVQET
ncbi:unnamed protein product [Ostreobium quekettii]|uniref:Bestrophin/UPF0187 n=1 Tax=Ostreobium quekettii TaxID=121088 RepID=A0A8S1JD74_9CHLO|nr:unnamed protein product [Ostreobium quekettii]|eukprot:evm.model.scf_62EXC.5 EVM.evm.TU.scf_62EXC.5   scf_62EXC:61257-69241(-)